MSLLKGRSGARLSLKQALVILDQGSVRFSPERRRKITQHQIRFRAREERGSCNFRCLQRSHGLERISKFMYNS